MRRKPNKQGLFRDLRGVERHELPDFLKAKLAIKRLRILVARITRCEHVLEKRSGANLQDAIHHDPGDSLVTIRWRDEQIVDPADLSGR